MNPGRRAAAGEYVQRVNRAARLLRQVGSLGEVIAKVARLYAVSPRQARRYVEAAQQVRGPLPLPEAKVVLTVKVPASLPVRVRQRAHAEGRSLSDLVTCALNAYLRRRPPSSRGHPPEN
jgi:transposase-like protein